MAELRNELTDLATCCSEGQEMYQIAESTFALGVMHGAVSRI